MESPEPRPRIRYASAGNKHLAAAINGLYLFRTPEQAQAKLDSIKRQFTIAASEEEGAPTILWIRDFELTPEDEQAGYLGHYACIQCTRMDDEDGHYTLSVSKVDRPLKNHPLRKRPASRCPNWGHPVLRSVLKGKLHPTLDSANADLQQLHLEYPETTVPAQNKLYLMVFSRRDNPKQPIEKYVLEIKNAQGGGFTIESSKNVYKPKATSRPTTAESPEEPPAPMGHFASMVALKKRKTTPKT